MAETRDSGDLFIRALIAERERIRSDPNRCAVCDGIGASPLPWCTSLLEQPCWNCRGSGMRPISKTTNELRAVSGEEPS